MAKKSSGGGKKVSSPKKSPKKVSTETGRWNGHKFIVSSTLIRGFNGLQIEGSCETKDKTKSKQEYVSRKKGKPAEVSFSVYLNAETGCSARSEALAFVEEAAKGKKDYFYVGNKKLVTYKLMLVKASVKEITIAHNHEWVSAEVSLTFKQTGTGGKSSGNSNKKNTSKSTGGGGSYSSSGSQKQSVKNTSTTTTKVKVKDLAKTGNKVVKATSKKSGLVTTVKNALTGKKTTSTTTKVVSTAVNVIGGLMAAAKKASAAKK